MAQSASTTACVVRQRARACRVALVPLERSTELTVVGSMPLTAGVAVTPLRRRARSARRDLVDAGHRLHRRRPTFAGIGVKPSWFWTISAAETWSSIVLFDRAAQARGEHRDQHDEREADHQRRGGDRRALRLADRVLARELPGQALRAPAASPARAPAAGPAAAPGTRSRTSSAPRRGRAATAAADAESMPPKRPKNSASRPRPISTTEPTIRRLRRCPRPGVTASRIAVTGSTRVARRAGTKPGDHRRDQADRRGR